MLYNWPNQMIDNQETWKADDLPTNIQSSLVDYIIERRNTLQFALRHAHIRISESTSYRENQKSLVAKLKSIEGAAEFWLSLDGGIIDLMMLRDAFKVCLTEDFYGQFELLVTPMLWKREYDTLHLIVQVSLLVSYHQWADSVDGKLLMYTTTSL